MNRYQDRPKSSQLIDLAVYIVPPELWREQLHSAGAQTIPETISAGFIRVEPDLLILRLREELDAQLGEEQILPRDYVFLKNVGRCLTRVRTKQERELKIKNFVTGVGPTPNSAVAEIFLLEAGSDTRSMLDSSHADSYQQPTPPSADPYQLGSYRDRREGAFNQHKPVPPIQSASSPRPANSASRNILSDPEQTKSASTFRSTKSPLPPISRESKGSQSQLSQPGRRSNTQDQLSNSTASIGEGESNAQQGSVDQENTPTQSRAESNMDDVPFEQMNGVGSDGDDTDEGNDPGEVEHAPDHSSPPVAPTARNGPPLSATPLSSPHPPRDQPITDRQETPLSATLPASPVGQSSATKSTGRPAPYDQGNSHPTTGDSGLGFDDTERKRNEQLRRQQQEDELRRQQQLRELELREEQLRKQEEQWKRDRQLKEDRLHEEDEAEAQRRAADKAQRRDEEARRRAEEEEEVEEERRRAEAEARRREHEEDLRRRQERMRQQQEQFRQQQEEGKSRQQQPQKPPPAQHSRYEERREQETPSPPPITQNGHIANEATPQDKQTLYEELERLRVERHDAEKRREELVKRAKQLQGKSQNKRNQARDIWKKKYFEEKKKTPPLEDQVNKLSQELDQLHRKVMSTLEVGKEQQRGGGRSVSEKPSAQSNLKIQATRLQHEIEDLQRRVDNIKMKLTAEMKLRNQAESELRALRAELTEKKINVTLARTTQRDNMGDVYGSHQAPALSTGS